jgi:hypothetical protein
MARQASATLVPRRPARRRLPAAGLVLALAAGFPAGADEAEAARIPPPSLELGLGFTRTPGWLGDRGYVNHGCAWANAEYTTRSLGRFQFNGGTLTMDAGGNWDPWVQGIASFGVMVGYHGSSALGEGRSPRLAGDGGGLDAGVQAVLPVAGVPLIVQARKALDADQGWFLVLGSYLPVDLGGGSTLAFLPSTRWLDRKQAGFSFDTPSGAPGPAFRAGSGFQDVALEAILDWQFSAHWHGLAMASQRWLTGPAAATPLSLSHTQRALLTGFSYHF